MTHTMIALVTGANKGIGRQIAGQLAVLGHIVVIGSRSAEAGERAASELRTDGHDASSVVLDVTDPASAAAAARSVKARYGRLDALVNNAGISTKPGADFAGQLARSADVDHVRFVFETNVFALITVISAFLPLLRASSAPRIVNVTSSAGSLALMSDPALAEQHPIALGYVTSKTAATALTVQYARDLAADHILVNAVDPGFVATDLNGFRGARTPAQGAVAAVAMATIAADGPTGTFSDDQGPPSRGDPAPLTGDRACHHLRMDADSSSSDVEVTDEDVSVVVEVFAMLADATRVRLLWALRAGEMTVSELAETVGKPAASVSQHLAKLRLARLVHTRRQGTYVHYRVENTHVMRLVTDAVHHADHLGSEAPRHHSGVRAVTA